MLLATYIICVYGSDCFTDYFYIVKYITDMVCTGLTVLHIIFTLVITSHIYIFTGLTILHIACMLLVTISSLQTGKDRGEKICHF